VAVPGTDLTLHLSTERQDGTWLVELRRTANKATVPHAGGAVGDRHSLPGGAEVVLRQRFSRKRLWLAELRTGGFRSVPDFLRVHGRPIRYGYVPASWPLSAYQTVFATQPGSAEMPSAGRPFTPEIITRLTAQGVLVAPLVLHCGVSSPDAGEPPAPEPFRIGPSTARLVNATRLWGGRVIAVGTTVVRALETVASADGSVAAGSGWTSLVIDPERGVHAVDGLITGWHEPEASHLWMLAALAGEPFLERCYRAALDHGYLWHEFGDSHLILR
jgi:S-adenosylmethionine:tRNA ribosyltransferase-isomerase